MPIQIFFAILRCSVGWKIFQTYFLAVCFCTVLGNEGQFRSPVNSGHAIHIARKFRWFFKLMLAVKILLAIIYLATILPKYGLNFRAMKPRVTG